MLNPKPKGLAVLLTHFGGAASFMLLACSAERNPNRTRADAPPAASNQESMPQLGLMEDSGANLDAAGTLEPISDEDELYDDLSLIVRKRNISTASAPSRDDPRFDGRSLDNAQPSSVPTALLLEETNAAQQQQQQARDVWVRCDGAKGTAGDGSKDKPFNNLFSAQLEVRKRKELLNTGHLYVNVSGDCRLQKPLELTSQDSGKSISSQVIWRGQTLPGRNENLLLPNTVTAPARILGSSRVQFVPESSGSATWVVDIPDEAKKGRDLYIKRGESYRRARAARTSSFQFDKNEFGRVGGQYLDLYKANEKMEDFRSKCGGLVSQLQSPFEPTKELLPDQMTIPEGSQLVIMRAFGMSRLKVSGHQHKAGQKIPIDPDLQSAVFCTQKGWGDSRKPWTGWFENVFSRSFMNEAREWAIQGGKAYYMSVRDDMRIGELAHQPTLIRFNGTSHVTFKNFELAFTTWDSNYNHVPYRHTSTIVYRGSMPKRGFYREPAALELRNSKNIAIIGNAFRHLGGQGIQFIADSQENKIQGNYLFDVGINAIEIDSRPAIMGLGNLPPAPPATTATPAPRQTPAPAASRGDMVLNNLIVQAGEKDWGGMGILIGFAQNLRVRNNHIWKTSYIGISSGGTLRNCWKPNGFNPNDDCWNRSEIFIEENLVERAMNRSQDGGAIYVNGQQPKTSVKNNVVRGIKLCNCPEGAFVTGLYFDTGSTGMTVVNNSIPDPAGAGIHFNEHDPPQTKIENDRNAWLEHYKAVQHLCIDAKSTTPEACQKAIRGSNTTIEESATPGLKDPYAEWLRALDKHWRGEKEL